MGYFVLSILLLDVTSLKLYCLNMHQTLAATHMEDNELTESMQKLLLVMQRLDQKIGPMLDEDGELFNKRLFEDFSFGITCPFNSASDFVSS